MTSTPPTVPEPLNARTMPPWLKLALDSAARQKGTVPVWLFDSQGVALPPVLLGDRRLSDDQVQALLLALQASTFAFPHPLVSGLRKHANPASLDVFVWRLFEMWLAARAPAQEKWAMNALAYLGGDTVVLKLAPLIRAWPAEGQYARAVHGLECLRAIGSDTALMQLHAMSLRLRSKGLQNKAREFLEAIATARGLSTTELEDRIVPSCGLDSRGSRVFDFGSRSFRFVLGPDLKPLVKDEQGKVKADLPKPGQKDDADRARVAVDDWKLLKKQVREVIKVQAERLEQALVVGRRWSVADFEAFLVRHPLLFHLARRLLWAGYDPDGKRLCTFRVTEEQEYADTEDQPLQLAGTSRVGLVHPLHLSEEEKGAWGEVFGDYEIVQPFPQLGRPVFTLASGDRGAVEFTRFKGVKVPGVSLLGTLTRHGWHCGDRGDHGECYLHVKHFPVSDVTALVQHEPGIPAGNPMAAEEQTLKLCCFARGNYQGKRFPRYDPLSRPTMTLGEVDAVIFSEVFKDLNELAAKAEK